MLLLPLLAGGLWQRAMTVKESAANPPPGKLYSINGHDMHLYGAGTGDQTVVFVPGSGTPSSYTDFYYIQHDLQHEARTVSYDRPGFGWSEPAEEPRTIDALAEELHLLLGAANEQPPYILVGHSLASLEVIRFAQQYPEDVRAMVLLDSGSPEYYAQKRELTTIALNRSVAFLRASGIARALGSAGFHLPFAGEGLRYNLLSEEVGKVDLAMFYKHIGSPNNLGFIRNMNENALTVIRHGPLTNVPMLVLSAESGAPWASVQEQLLNWSSAGRQIIVSDAHHYLHWTHRKLVVDEIKTMLRASN